jgi:hypothetical protein
VDPDQDPFGVPKHPAGDDNPFGGDSDNPFGSGTRPSDAGKEPPDDANPFDADPFGLRQLPSKPERVWFCAVNDQPTVSMDVKDVPLGAALERMLQPLDLVWFVLDETIIVTIPEERDMHLDTRIYLVEDLLTDEDGLICPDYHEALSELVYSTVQWTDWDRLLTGLGVEWRARPTPLQGALIPVVGDNDPPPAGGMFKIPQPRPERH